MDFGSVLERYELSGKEMKALNSKIEALLKKIAASIRKNRLAADVVVGGSASKGVLLKGDFDVDLFVRFDKRYKDGELSNLLENALKQFKPVRLQGSRDYFQFSEGGINYEVVPVRKIKAWREAVNVTDASPLHVTWVNSRIRKEPRLREEIILTKVFLKANRLYGAESYIGGFSGHVVDILVLNYGGFVKFLRAATKWKPYCVVDVERHYKGKSPDLNQSKIGPLILIDPVQPQRNAAAAVSLETFNRLIEVANRYLEKPSLKFFERDEKDAKRLGEVSKGNRLMIAEVTLKRGKLDVNGAKIVKALEFLSSRISEADFKILEKGWEWNKGPRALIWLIADAKKLDKIKIHAGPPAELKTHAAAFKRLYKKAYLKDGRLFAEVKREFVEPEVMFDRLLGDVYMTSKFKKIENKSEKKK